MTAIITFEAGEAVPALPAADLEIAKDFAHASKAAATRRAYQKDFARFTAWCDQRRIPPIPAAPETGAAARLIAVVLPRQWRVPRIHVRPPGDGASAIPENTSLVDWPLSYADLEPYYDRAEYELGVSGKAGNLQGKKIDGGNVFEAPRRRDYPLPPLLVERASALFDAGAKKLGYHPFSTPRAIISEPYNGRPACTYCGFCQAFGCHVGAKSSILVTKLPEADATGNFRLVTGAMCYRVNSDIRESGIEQRV
jgi:choline dehydrogenase-like flavoprotein